MVRFIQPIRQDLFFTEYFSSRMAKWNSAKSDRILKKGGFDFGAIHIVSLIRNTSPQKFTRIEVIASLNFKGEVTDKDIVKIVKHIVKKMRQKRVRIKDQYGEKGLLRHPRFITLRIFTVEKRLRGLVSLWTNQEVALIAEWSINWNLYKPFYTRDQVHYADRNLRIKLNTHLMKNIPEP